MSNRAAKRSIGHQRTLKSRHAGKRHRAAAAVAGAASVKTILHALWKHPDVDIDALVDSFARTHDAEAYRSPKFQKAAVDQLMQQLLDSQSPQQQMIRDLADRSYTRFLLAGDVGFELGFHAARALLVGR